MWIGIAITALIISLSIMLLIARKWNIYNRSTFLVVTFINLIAAMPSLWINYYKTGWQLILGAVFQIGLSLLIGLFLVLFRFSRDPERVPIETDGVILSAADGEVVYVWDLPENFATIVKKGNRTYNLDELLGTTLASGKVYVVGVGMNFLDVHVNRCPISGQVRLLKHIDGKFISLRIDEAPFINERFTTIIENETINVAIVQIASRLVRRIESFLDIGDAVNAGQRLGMIRLGSLVSIIFPDRDDMKIEVKPGDYVMAGISILARYR